MSAYQSILAVTFGTELSDRAVREAARIAHAMAATLLVLHVRSPIDVPDHTTGGALTRLGADKISEEINADEKRLLDAALQVAAAEGVRAETAFVTDISTHQAVIRVATERRCDLIVMATRIRHGIPGYFAKSETQKVLENTAIPVLVVR